MLEGFFKGAFQTETMSNNALQTKKESSETGMNIGFGRKDVVKQKNKYILLFWPPHPVFLTCQFSENPLFGHPSHV